MRDACGKDIRHGRLAFSLIETNKRAGVEIHTGINYL